jgi:hypothetical protein
LAATALGAAALPFELAFDAVAVAFGATATVAAAFVVRAGAFFIGSLVMVLATISSS